MLKIVVCLWIGRVYGISTVLLQILSCHLPLTLNRVFFISEPAAFLLCVNMYESVTHSGFYRCKILIFLTLLHLAPQGRNLFFCSALSSEWLCAYFIFIQQERK